METNNYNQYSSKYLSNFCSGVSLLNILKYRYAIIVKPDFIMRLAMYFENLGKRIPSFGADFSIITPAFISYLNLKFGLKFVLGVKYLSLFNKTDVNTYMIWIKGYSTTKFNKIKADGIITKEEMDYLRTFSGGVNHAVAWDYSGGGYLIDTDGKSNTKLSLETLQYGVKLGLFGDKIRTIDTGDKETEEVVKLTVKMFEAEKINRLEYFIEKNKNSNPYMSKAIALYKFGR